MIESGETSNEARSILLGQKKIQDALAAVAQYIPSVFYVLTAFVYTPLMFMVRESLLLPVWITFAVQILVIWGVFGARAVMARRTERFYETVALKRPSDPTSTVEMLWTDRLVELRQYTRYQMHSLVFWIAEPVLWLGFSLMVYLLIRHYLAG